MQPCLIYLHTISLVGLHPTGRRCRGRGRPCWLPGSEEAGQLPAAPVVRPNDQHRRTVPRGLVATATSRRRLLGRRDLCEHVSVRHPELQFSIPAQTKHPGG